MRVFVSRFVFTRTRGECIRPAHVSQRFSTLVRQLGLPRVRLHDLRHTSASLGLAGGESLLEVSRRLGHLHQHYRRRHSHITAVTAHDSADRLARTLEA
jgi:integrase